MPEPVVSAVVAAWPDGRGLDTCLAALAPQQGPEAEVLVVSTRPQPALEGRFPGIIWITVPPDLLIPHLWAAGIERARGAVVALTTAHFRPAEDWLAVIRSSHERLDAAAVGGAIEPRASGSGAYWATYFARYSAYLALDREQDLRDLAGDNAAYKRTTLAPWSHLLADGFWEQEFHKRFLAAGVRLTFVPRMRVVMEESFGFVGFLKQRFQHGRQFGGTRVRGHGRAFRLAAILGSPVIPAILLIRIAGRVLSSGRYLGALLRCLPVLACFVTAWALGEASGYLSPVHPRTAGRGKASPA